jgi:outer membrane protein TolC
MKLLVALLLTALCASAEVKTLTLRQALDMALAQNPDLLLARLDQQKARSQVTVTRDPFSPKIYAGSGAAYTYGFPSSIEGSAPAIVQVKTQMALFNRPLSYQVAQSNEAARGAAIDVARKQDEVIYRVTSLYLDAEQAARSLDAARRQAASLLRVRELMDQRVAEGRELAIESKKSNLAALRANQHLDTLSLDLLNAEGALGLALGMGPDDRVRAAPEERAPLTVGESEEASIEAALEGSKELKTLESNMQAKMLEIKSYRAERLPKINLVAQYSLFAKSTYQAYFTEFQRNNAQIGMSIEVPLITGRSGAALVSESQADIAKLRIEVGRTRARITNDLRAAYQDLKRAEMAREVARADLDLARATEDEKWLAYYESQHTAELARLNVLQRTGTLDALMR